MGGREGSYMRPAQAGWHPGTHPVQDSAAAVSSPQGPTNHPHPRGQERTGEERTIRAKTILIGRLMFQANSGTTLDFKFLHCFQGKIV